MHASLFESYQVRQSLVHSLDPRVKVLLVVGVILSNAFLPDGAWIPFGLTWLLILLFCRLAIVNFGYLLTRSVLFLPFILAAVTIIFTIPGDPIWTMQIFGRTFQATDTGLVRFVSIILRSWLSVQAAILLVLTTQFPDLIHALTHLKVPKVITAIIAFMYRYLYVLYDEAVRLLRARQARSARIPGQKAGGTLAWRARSAGNIAGQLFIRSYERADRVYNAMVARGYRGELLTSNPHRMNDHDWNFLIAGVLGLLIIQWIARLI
jgi:cobalt/nickel transport system permease protein